MANMKTAPSTLLILAAAGCLLGAACTSNVAGKATGQSNGTSAGAGAGAGASASAGGSAGSADLGNPPKMPGAPAAESAGILPLRRLTHREYSNTMAELLADTSDPGAKFEPDVPGPAGYDAPDTVAKENARDYMDTAESLAAGRHRFENLEHPLCGAGRRGRADLR